MKHQSSLASLVEPLLAWYEQARRPLPWRGDASPYHVWLSEIMLQQTRIEAVIPYYERFLAAYPTVHALAAADDEQLMKLWEGLGYYSRARNLHAAARQVVEAYGGRFPDTFEELRKLRGVGDYTAAAIASMAFDRPTAVVDGNVYRVLGRLFDLEVPIDSGEGRRSYAALAAELLDTKNPATYNQAIMDFGAMVCTPQSPACATCPLQGQCQALAAGTVAQRPVKQGRTKLRDRYFHFLHLQSNGHTLLHRRGAGDIWQGLYEFPLVELSEAGDFAALSRSERFTEWLGGRTFRLCESRPMPLHQLSHQRLHATFHRIEIEPLPTIEGMLPIREEELGDYAVSRLMQRYLER